MRRALLRRPVAVTVGIAVVLVLVAAATVVASRWWGSAHRSLLEQASAYAPGDAQRLSWTDWAAVRAETGVSLDAGSSGAAVQGFLDRAFERDLTSASAMVASARDLQRRYGFSPATVDWELFSQSTSGAAVIAHLPSSVPVSAVAARLERSGLVRPAVDATDGQPWVGGPEALARAGAVISPELQYVALDAERSLVVTSDSESYLETVVRGLSSGPGLPAGVADVVAGAGSPVSAVVYAGEYACTALAMSQADAADQAAGESLVRTAGTVNPVTGFAMAVQPSGHVRALLAFETPAQARANADPRAALASGPAPGQGGTFPDRFALVSASATGRVLTLDLKPRDGSYVLSDLSSGPVLFATC